MTKPRRDPRLKANPGQDLRPLFRAIEEGDLDAVKTLTTPARLDATGNYTSPLTGSHPGTSPLLLATVVGQTRVARYLLDQGARLDMRWRDGSTPLHQAAKRDWIAIARLLAQRGAELEARDELEETPLFSAARWASTAMARLLLAAGADVRARSDTGATLLHSVIPHDAGLLAKTKLFLDAGADIDARDAKGRTPLHDAVINGFTGVAKLLIERGADLGAVDAKGRRPVDYALDGAMRAAVAPKESEPRRGAVRSGGASS